MRYPILCTLVLAISMCLVPMAVAQSSTDRPLVMNPQRYPGNVPVQPASAGVLPPELTLPAGTLVIVRLTGTLSSDHNLPGDGFTAVLDQPLVAQGWVVANRGQTVVGRVVAARKAGRTQGVSQLAVDLSELVLADGSQVPIQTQMAQSSAGTSYGRDAVGVGTSAGVGAMIGGAAGGGEGAAIGAAAGAVAGIIGVLSTRGRATELYPETVLIFRLDAPVTIQTLQSRQAFRPVTPQDYNGNDGRRNEPRTLRAAEAYPPPAPYYYSPYYYPGYGYYGYYGHYGFGARIIVSPRVVIGGHGYYRHHH
jgi:hypothetical protein